MALWRNVHALMSQVPREMAHQDPAKALEVQDMVQEVQDRDLEDLLRDLEDLVKDLEEQVQMVVDQS